MRTIAEFSSLVSFDSCEEDICELDKYAIIFLITLIGVNIRQEPINNLNTTGNHYLRKNIHYSRLLQFTKCGWIICRSRPTVSNPEFELYTLYVE